MRAVSNEAKRPRSSAKCRLAPYRHELERRQGLLADVSFGSWLRKNAVDQNSPPSLTRTRQVILLQSQSTMCSRWNADIALGIPLGLSLEVDTTQDNAWRIAFELQCCEFAGGTLFNPIA